jgi:hypothetical protein
MEWVVDAMPRQLYSQGRPGTHRQEAGWGTGAVVDRWGKPFPRGFRRRTTSPLQVAIPTPYTGSQLITNGRNATNKQFSTMRLEWGLSG